MTYILEVNALHEEAMDYAERAFQAKRSKRQQEATHLFREAYTREAEAARLVNDQNGPEPSRSVLLRSAASLALHCGELREAEKLVALVLLGDAPLEIAEEVRDLLEEISFARHLRLQGIALESTDIQLSIAGNAIGYGIAPSEVVLQRIARVEKLIHRTIDRLHNQPYREPRPSAQTVRNYNFYISVPRAASFSVTIRLGRIEQPWLEGLSDVGLIFDDLMENLNLVNNDNYERLKNKFASAAYFRNFVALTKAIAPDGEKVSLVGLTKVRNGREESVSLTKSQAEIPVRLLADEGRDDPETAGEEITIFGRLRYADARREDKGEVRLTDTDGNTWRVTVPEGLMNDIVKPYWDEETWSSSRCASARRPRSVFSFWTFAQRRISRRRGAGCNRSRAFPPSC